MQIAKLVQESPAAGSDRPDARAQGIHCRTEFVRLVDWISSHDDAVADQQDVSRTGARVESVSTPVLRSLNAQVFLPRNEPRWFS